MPFVQGGVIAAGPGAPCSTRHVPARQGLHPLPRAAVKRPMVLASAEARLVALPERVAGAAVTLGARPEEQRLAERDVHPQRALLFAVERRRRRAALHGALRNEENAGAVTGGQRVLLAP